MGHTVFCNIHFVLEFGQFISVTWINLLREFGIWSDPPPPVGTLAQMWVGFFLNEPFLTQFVTFS